MPSFNPSLPIHAYELGYGYGPIHADRDLWLGTLALTAFALVGAALVFRWLLSLRSLPPSLIASLPPEMKAQLILARAFRLRSGGFGSSEFIRADLAAASRFLRESPLQNPNPGSMDTPSSSRLLAQRRALFGAMVALDSDS